MPIKKWDVAKVLSDTENKVEDEIAYRGSQGSENIRYSLADTILMTLLPILDNEIRAMVENFIEKWGVDPSEKLADVLDKIDDDKKEEFKKEKRFINMYQKKYEDYVDRMQKAKSVRYVFSPQQIEGKPGYMVKEEVTSVEVPATMGSLNKAYEISEKIRKSKANTELSLIISQVKADLMHLGYFDPRAKTSVSKYMQLFIQSNAGGRGMMDTDFLTEGDENEDNGSE